MIPQKNTLPVLLIGGSGMLGSVLCEILKIKNIPFSSPSSQELDVLDTESYKDFLIKNKNNFRCICFAAGYTHVDAAEQNREACFSLNTQPLIPIVELGIPIIYFSSDYVFGDTVKGPIPTDTPQSPLNVYGESKTQAETLLEQSSSPWWSIRTSWLYGYKSHNFITTMLRLIQEKKPLKVVNDEIGRLTNVEDLGKTVIDKLFTNTPLAHGHYHITGSGEPCSWAEVTRFILDYKNSDIPLTPISAESWNAPASRPKNSVLKISEEFEMEDWKVSLKNFLDTLA